MEILSSKNAFKNSVYLESALNYHVRHIKNIFFLRFRQVLSVQERILSSPRLLRPFRDKNKKCGFGGYQKVYCVHPPPHPWGVCLCTSIKNVPLVSCVFFLACPKFGDCPIADQGGVSFDRRYLHFYASECNDLKCAVFP